MFNSPHDIAFDGNGLMYVLSRAHSDIVIIDPDSDNLTPIFVLGAEGSGEEEFLNPESLEIVGDFLYVSDTENNRISKFDIPDFQ